MKARLFSIVSGLLLTAVFFQNCSRAENVTVIDGSAYSSSQLLSSNSSSTGTGNGDGYGGKIGIYTAPALPGECVANSSPIKAQVEVRANGVYRLYRDCQKLDVEERVPDTDVFFAEKSQVIIIDGILYIRASVSRPVSLAEHYAYFFCTNRWNATPDVGFEVRMVKRVDGSDRYRAQIFAKDFRGATPVIIEKAFVSVEHSLLLQGFGAKYDPTGAAFGFHYQNNSELRGQGFVDLFFRRSYEEEAFIRHDLKCWSAEIAKKDYIFQD